MDSRPPTHSSTESAPIPFVISLMRATPSSPRSVTMSVAPKSFASFCRDGCRLIAMMRSAPICLAESTPSKPTAPSPTTTTVEPGFTCAASAANQPVPSTSETVRRLGRRSSDGFSGVAMSVPSASGTRAYGACAPVMNSRCWHPDWYPARQFGQVLSEIQNDPMTNWPGFTVFTALPTSSTKPQYSCPIAWGSVTGWMPRQGHKSEPHTQLTARRMMASVGLRIFGSGRSSYRTFRGPYKIVAFIFLQSPPSCGNTTAAAPPVSETLSPISGPPVSEDVLGNEHPAVRASTSPHPTAEHQLPSG